MKKLFSAVAVVSGREFSADLGAADLSLIASKWPYLVLIAGVIILLLILVNVFFRAKKDKQGVK